MSISSTIMRNLKFIFQITILGVSTVSCSSQQPLQADQIYGLNSCEITKEVRSEGSEVFNLETEYRDTRNQLFRQLLIEAVERVNGVELVTRISNQVELHNSDLDTIMRTLDIEKTQGLVKSYNFPVDGELVEDLENGSKLTLKVDVIVCDHSNLRDHLYFAIGDIKFNQFDEGYQVDQSPLRTLVASAVPPKSRITIIQNPLDQYYDYLVTGEIHSVTAVPHISTWKAVLGGIVKTGSGRPIVDPREVRMSTVITLRAQSYFDSSYTTVHETIEDYTRPTEALEGRIDEFTQRSLQEVAGMLYEKVAQQADK